MIHLVEVELPYTAAIAENGLEGGTAPGSGIGSHCTNRSGTSDFFSVGRGGCVLGPMGRRWLGWAEP